MTLLFLFQKSGYLLWRESENCLDKRLINCPCFIEVFHFTCRALATNTSCYPSKSEQENISFKIDSINSNFQKLNTVASIHFEQFSSTENNIPDTSILQTGENKCDSVNNTHISQESTGNVIPKTSRFANHGKRVQWGCRLRQNINLHPTLTSWNY